jgi:hypothetical protein
VKEEHYIMRSFIICSLYQKNVIRMTQSRKMRWEGYVPCMGKMRIAHKIMGASLKKRDHLGGLGIGGRIILRWILRKQCMEWLG